MKPVQSRGVFIGILVVIIIGLLIFVYGQKENSIQEGVISFIVPWQTISQDFNSLRSWSDDLLHFNSFRRSALRAKQENLRLLSQQSAFKEIGKENEILRDALGLKKKYHWHLVPAQIIFTDPLSSQSIFWINRGANEGLKPGMNVVLGSRILVGALTKCYPSFCQGISIFQPGLRLSVKDERSNVLAVSEKGKGGNFVLKLVSRDSDIKVGDILVTSKENRMFLPNLLVARVQKEQAVTGNLLRQFILHPLFSEVDTSSVLVITDFQGIPINSQGI